MPVHIFCVCEEHGGPRVVPVRVTRRIVPVASKNAAVPTVVGVATEQQTRNSRGTGTGKSPQLRLINYAGHRFPRIPLSQRIFKEGGPRAVPGRGTRRTVPGAPKNAAGPTVVGAATEQQDSVASGFQRNILLISNGR